ncbi:hypothetical protein NDU88_007717 [Pleurodeles waltl]|uniref:Uncharacterized protein n=1 Tax=Pleurodeles waltl TaxID=8319 RepID=A0AAV7U346_PLEWA|nr:hypothetical protein NDU88_007717 [Pleurodeles waltl]
MLGWGRSACLVLVLKTQPPRDPSYTTCPHYPLLPAIAPLPVCNLDTSTPVAQWPPISTSTAGGCRLQADNGVSKGVTKPCLGSTARHCSNPLHTTSGCRADVCCSLVSRMPSSLTGLGCVIEPATQSPQLLPALMVPIPGQMNLPQSLDCVYPHPLVFYQEMLAKLCMWKTEEKEGKVIAVIFINS